MGFHEHSNGVSGFTKAGSFLTDLGTVSFSRILFLGGWLVGWLFSSACATCLLGPGCYHKA